MYKQNFKPRKFEILAGCFTDAYVLYDMIGDGIKRRKELGVETPEEIIKLHKDLNKRLTK